MKAQVKARQGPEYGGYQQLTITINLQHSKHKGQTLMIAMPAD